MITLNQLQAICRFAHTQTLANFEAPLNAAMLEFDVDQPQREQFFIAQVAHESGEFRYLQELASGDSYNDRADLGNTRPEAIAIAQAHGIAPGRFWKGHGLLQITGYDNHKRCGDALGYDLVNNPLLIAATVGACRSSAWFWKTHGLNELADTGDFVAVTRKINGGINGLEDREMYLARATEVIA